MQTPTIGRRCYYWPSQRDLFGSGDAAMRLLDPSMPFDAGVVFVHGPELVNLVVTDHCGVAHCRMRVDFGVRRSDAGAWAEWMPYQKGASHTPAPDAASSDMPKSAKSEYPYPRFGKHTDADVTESRQPADKPGDEPT